MGVWYIMMSISMYMSCLFQWFLVFSDLWQPRSGPGFFPLSSARRCVWSALLEQLFQAAHTNIHEIFFMSVHHPKLLGTNVDRNFGALRSQAWRDCIFQLVPRSINRACMHVDALLAPIKSQAICPVEFAFAVVDTAVQTTKGRSDFWIARCAITAKQRLVPSVGCRNRIASSCSWYFRKTFWRRLAVPLCSCNTNVPKNELATSLVAGRIAFDHTEPLMIMQAATRLPMSHRSAIGFDDATQLHVTLHSHSNCSLMLQQDVHQAIQCPARRSRNSKLLSKHVSRRMTSV